MKIYYKRHNFAFTPELDKLIRDLAKETEWTLVKIIEKSVKLFAEERKKNGK